jgi:hypothetical protein
MNAREFRIGNLHEYHIKDEHSDEWIICDIDAIDLHELSDGKFLDDYRPLKITEEILLRFGFKRFEIDGVVGFDFFRSNEKTIWYEIGDFLIIQWGDDSPFFYSRHNLRIEIKYVHKLQNIYFEIESKELTYTP